MAKYCTYLGFILLVGWTMGDPKCSDSDTCPAEPYLCKIRDSTGKVVNCPVIATKEKNNLSDSTLGHSEKDANTVHTIRRVRDKTVKKVEKLLERRRRAVSSGEDEEWGLGYKKEEEQTTWNFLRKPTRTQWPRNRKEEVQTLNEGRSQLLNKN